jgi:hypothetical protein
MIGKFQRLAEPRVHCERPCRRAKQGQRRSLTAVGSRDAHGSISRSYRPPRSCSAFSLAQVFRDCTNLSSTSTQTWELPNIVWRSDQLANPAKATCGRGCQKLRNNFNNIRVRSFVLSGAPFAYRAANPRCITLFCRRYEAPRFRAGRFCLGSTPHNGVPCFFRSAIRRCRRSSPYLFL